MSDFRIPVPGGAALPSWRRNPGYSHMGLSAEAVAALDESEITEAMLAERLKERTAANRARILGQNAEIEVQQAEQRRTEALSDEALRAELTVAIDAHGAAQRVLAAANQALERARRGVEDAESRLGRFAGVDEKIAAFNADRFRGGGLATMPADLIEARCARRDAVQLLEDVREAYVALAGEAQAARLRVEDAAQVRDQAAVAIIARHVEGVAVQIEEAVDRLYDLRRQALSVSALWVPMAGGAQAPVQVSDRTRAALRRTEQRPPVDESAKAAARDWYCRLLSDPLAEMEG